jgi:hypothetical protein
MAYGLGTELRSMTSTINVTKCSLGGADADLLREMIQFVSERMTRSM